MNPEDTLTFARLAEELKCRDDEVTTLKQMFSKECERSLQITMQARRAEGEIARLTAERDEARAEVEQRSREANEERVKVGQEAERMLAALATARAEVVAEAAAIARAQTYFPDTHTGKRQEWVKLEIAEKIEALAAPHASDHANSHVAESRHIAPTGGESRQVKPEPVSLNKPEAKEGGVKQGVTGEMVSQHGDLEIRSAFGPEPSANQHPKPAPLSPETSASINRGLADAAAGRVASPGSFAQHADTGRCSSWHVLMGGCTLRHDHPGEPHGRLNGPAWVSWTAEEAQEARHVYDEAARIAADTVTVSRATLERIRELAVTCMSHDALLICQLLDAALAGKPLKDLDWHPEPEEVNP